MTETGSAPSEAPRRLKVLLSAYACEPGKGSEPEVGWQWALHMARYHDVTVLTRANNQATIQAEIAKLVGKQPLPRFVFHDCNRWLLGLKRGVLGTRGYYWFWQRTARRMIATLHLEQRFDLMHHVTFAGFRFPGAIWGHGVPTIWGPVGGVESFPWHLLPWRHPSSLLSEVLRNFGNRLQTTNVSSPVRRARLSTVVLVSTHEAQTAFARHDIATVLMPTIGLSANDFSFISMRRVRVPVLRLLFAGRLLAWKGLDLALAALATPGLRATLDVFGEGPYEPVLRREARRRGLTARVVFRGRIRRSELLNRYGDYDAFLFPSLHDTGGYALIEAMANGLPPVCLDCGGPAIAVAEGCGQKIPLASRRQIIAGLADAIRRYETDESLRIAHGHAARQTVLDRYEWTRKAEEMNGIYHMAVEKFARERGGCRPAW